MVSGVTNSTCTPVGALGVAGSGDAGCASGVDGDPGAGEAVLMVDAAEGCRLSSYSYSMVNGSWSLLVDASVHS